MPPLARPLAILLAWWAVAFWFTVLLFGSWDGLELMACGAIGLAAGAAAAAVSVFEPLGYRGRAGWLRELVAVPHQVVVDYVILTRELLRALVRRRAPAGVFRAKPYDAGRPHDRLSAGRRAFVGVAAGYSPNAYIVEIDPERQQILLHDLVANERSEAPG